MFLPLQLTISEGWNNITSCASQELWIHTCYYIKPACCSVPNFALFLKTLLCFFTIGEGSPINALPCFQLIELLLLPLNHNSELSMTATTTRWL